MKRELRSTPIFNYCGEREREEEEREQQQQQRERRRTGRVT